MSTSSTRHILLLGHAHANLASAAAELLASHPASSRPLQFHTATNLPEVHAALTAADEGAYEIEAVFVGGRIDPAVRAESVRAVFERSRFTDVYCKGWRGLRDGFVPFVRSCL